MKIALFPIGLTLALAWAGQTPLPPAGPQLASAPAAAVTLTVEKPRISRAAVAELESLFEQKLKAPPEATDTFVRMGACSGLYLNGYGLVFAMPLDLIQTPKVSPFQQVISKQSKAATHARKLAQLPVLKKAMRDMLIKAAGTATGVPPNEKIVMAARLFYLDWEDTSGLPTQIVASADRASALAGNVQMEEQ